MKVDKKFKNKTKNRLPFLPLKPSNRVQCVTSCLIWIFKREFRGNELREISLLETNDHICTEREGKRFEAPREQTLMIWTPPQKKAKDDWLVIAGHQNDVVSRRKLFT